MEELEIEELTDEEAEEIIESLEIVGQPQPTIDKDSLRDRFKNL